MTRSWWRTEGGQRGTLPHPWGDLLPSDLFHRQVYVNYWFEQVTPELVSVIGEDNILFETDFPHRTCLEGDEITEASTTHLAGLSEAVRAKILWGNAASLYESSLLNCRV